MVWCGVAVWRGVVLCGGVVMWCGGVHKQHEVCVTVHANWTAGSGWGDTQNIWRESMQLSFLFNKE